MRPTHAVVVSLWPSEYDAKYPGLGKCVKAHENRPLGHAQASFLPTRLPEEPNILATWAGAGTRPVGPNGTARDHKRCAELLAFAMPTLTEWI